MINDLRVESVRAIGSVAELFGADKRHEPHPAVRATLPSAWRTSLRSVWPAQRPPTGMISRPPGLSWSTSAGGTRPPLAEAMIAS